VTSGVERAPLSDPLVIAAGRTVAQRRPAETAAILSNLDDVSRVAWVGGGGGDRGRAGRDALDGTGIEVTGWLPHDEAIDRLAEANVYLHWTAWDGLPMTVLEAVSLGTVVIASDIGPNSELLGRDGVCASKGEAVRLIRWLLANPVELEAMAARQRARCKTFTCDTMIDGWLNDYRDLLPPERVPAVVRTAIERAQLPRAGEPLTLEQLESADKPAARIDDAVPPPPARRFVRSTDDEPEETEHPARLT
jgi:glycosyltransferase involved in cell wall biosynthesis